MARVYDLLLGSIGTLTLLGALLLQSAFWPVAALLLAAALSLLYSSLFVFSPSEGGNTIEQSKPLRTSLKR